MPDRVRTLCPYCGVGCGLIAKAREGRLSEVEGDPIHPVNRGRVTGVTVDDLRQIAIETGISTEALAIALREAEEPGFAEYAQRIVTNARRLADTLQQRGARRLTEGTDNHLVMVDVTNSFGLTGRQAESALRSCKLTLNRNSLPFDPNGAWYTSGLRLGVPATTTLGMGADEMAEIADIVVSVLSDVSPATITNDDGTTKPSKARFELADATAERARKRVDDLLSAYRLYPQLTVDIEPTA